MFGYSQRAVIYENVFLSRVVLVTTRRLNENGAHVIVCAMIERVEHA